MAITDSNISICSVLGNHDYFYAKPPNTGIDVRNYFASLGTNIYESAGNETDVTIFENDILRITAKANKNAGRPYMRTLSLIDKRNSYSYNISPNNLRNCYLALGYDESEHKAYYFLAGQFYYSGDWNVNPTSSVYCGLLGGSSAIEQEMYELISGSQSIPSYTANGGGATHIAKITGQLSSLSSNLSDILIVSGGGGGGLIVGETTYTGRDAGGISGSGDNSGDQSTGNAFGLGESGSGASGGGGGLYGGYKGTNSKGGGAGSGYIANALVSNKKMVGYNVPTSDDTNTKTESVLVYSPAPLANMPKMGDGFARIKYLGGIVPPEYRTYINQINGSGFYWKDWEVKSYNNHVMQDFSPNYNYSWFADPRRDGFDVVPYCHASEIFDVNIIGSGDSYSTSVVPTKYGNFFTSGFNNYRHIGWIHTGTSVGYGDLTEFISGQSYSGWNFDFSYIPENKTLLEILTYLGKYVRNVNLYVNSVLWSRANNTN